jgi:putative peptide zinc metalloprotease protein
VDISAQVDGRDPLVGMVLATVNPNSPAVAIDDAWQRIAGLQLRLRGSLAFHQHRYRGESWLIIADQRDGDFFRCSVSAEPFLHRLDGTRSVEQALVDAKQRTGLELSQQDIVHLIANLKSSGLLMAEDGCGEGSETGGQAGNKKPAANSWLRPFAIRFALFNPDRFLEKTAHYYRPFLTTATAWVWAALVIGALITTCLHWPELAEHSETRFADPSNFLWYWLLYPIVKALHELGHASFTRAWGGAVREMGIMLLVFFPVPYVDSSAAHGFSDRRQRILVSAAGIMVETFLASIALFVWVYTDSGALHDMAFDIVIIGGISTVIFNANPLLRFDGYYILSELIQIPNLGTRSQQYLGYLFKHHVLDIPGLQSPVTATGEEKWLLAYGVGAGIYRVFISLFIAFWVAGKLFIIGLLLALWAVIAQVIYPALLHFSRLIPIARQANKLGRLGLVVSVFLILITVSLLMPAGNSTYAEGVVSLPENAYLRAGTDGIVTRILREDGVRVESGETVLMLGNIELETRRDILLARLEVARARQKDSFLLDRTQSESLKARAATLEAELDDIEAQILSLQVSSAVPGVVCLPLASDLPGRFINRGEVIGYIADLDQVTARVVVHQSDIERIRRPSRTIEVKLSSRPGETHTARLIRELPQATDRLPSRLLGSGAGGDVAVDARDDAGVQTISNVFQVEIALPVKTASGKHIGQRVYVRFIHEPEPLGSQVLSWLSQIMLRAPFV